MPTNLYQRGLQLFVEGNELAGADASAVSSFTDLSGNGRHLTASSSQPVINTGAVNGKKSVQFDGSNNPLKYIGNFTIRCGWMVVKRTGNFNSPYEGILSSLTDFGILVGIGGTNTMFDFLYSYYEYRLNDKIYSPVIDQYGVKTFSPPGPSSWSIIFFKFWTNLNVEGVQIGQDRNFTDRKMTGEIALLALYDRDFCEKEVRMNTESIANSYQLAIYDTFPFQSSKTDQSTIGKVIISDGQSEPFTHIKDDSKERYDLSFNDRDEVELGRTVSYWKSHYPSTRFLFRDYQIVPPRDLNVMAVSEIQKSGTQVNRLNYGFSVQESVISAGTFIPTAPTIPDESIPDTTPPMVSFTAPLPAATVSDTIPVTVSASDDFAVDHVEFYYWDGAYILIGSDSSAPYSVNFNTDLVPNGDLTFKAIAYDTAGLSSEAFVTVTAANTVDFYVDDSGRFYVDPSTDFYIEG